MATVRGHTHTKIDGSSRGECCRESGRRNDRTIAALIVVGMIALIGLVIWLASLGGTAPSGDFSDYDLWMGS